MIQWGIGVVTAIRSCNSRVQELFVELKDGTNAQAVHYVDTLPPVQSGDTVLLNITAVQLRLGSGGVHFVHAILPGDEDRQQGYDWFSSEQEKGHLMKLKYTSLQRKILAAEEMESGHHDVFRKENDISQVPVLIGELHSMLPAAAMWLNRRILAGEADKTNKLPRVAYVMTDGGALPLAWSKHVTHLQEMGLLAGTVTYGQAYGGDVETLNKFTALLAARHILKADVIIVAMGPGIAGTGTDLGHSSMEVGEIINAVSILKGIPIIIPRVSFADSRKRHYGIGHHTLTSLSVTALRSAVIPLPSNLPAAHNLTIRRQLQDAAVSKRHHIRFIDQIDIRQVMEICSNYPVPLTTMGRRVHEDPYFFLAVCTAAQAAEDDMAELSRNR